MKSIAYLQKFLLGLLCFVFFDATGFSQKEVTRVLNLADSLSIPSGNDAIRICDSMLSESKLNNNEQGILYRIKGKAFYFRGDYKNAAVYFDKSVKSLNGLSPEIELGLTLIEQAKLYRKLKMFPTSIATYQEAASIFEKNNDNNNLATVLNEWGVVYEMEEDYPKAIDFYKRSLSLKESSHDTMGIAYSNAFLSNVYMLMDDLNNAEKYAKISLRLFQQLNDPFRIASQSTDMASLYIKKKLYGDAIKLLDYSSGIAIKMNNRDLLSQNYLQLANIYTLISDYKTAYQYYQQYASLKDSLFTESSQKAIADLNIQYQTAEKNKKILEQENRLLQQRWYLVLSIILFGVAALIAFFIYRNRKLRETQLINEAKHQEEILQMESENRLQQDRLRISRDLHDNIGSYLTFINTTINSGNPEMDLLKKTTGESIAELRRTVWLINRPSVTIEEWLIKLHEYHLKIKNVFIRSSLSNPSLALTAVQATNLFRIVQEAVNNAVKYAGAEKIEIIVSQMQQNINVDITDNGKGFDLSNSKNGYGLENMKQRAQEIKGNCIVSSEPGKGTSISICLTVTE
ncbi:MAG: sensor histidine kinase [Bacteroidetes bacterium]|nr:sensor histidine kinase [Bacteroidota bacterium]